MQDLSNKLLIEAYLKAVEHELDESFIRLIETEMNKRDILRELKPV